MKLRRAHKGFCTRNESTRKVATVTASAIGNERGSIAPLGIGLVGILLAATFTFANASALMLFQERQTQRAEALALAVDDALNPLELQHAQTDETLLHEQASRFAAEADILDFKISTPDGLTVEAKVCSAFESPIAVPLVPIASGQMFCASAKARRG